MEEKSIIVPLNVEKKKQIRLIKRIFIKSFPYWFTLFVSIGGFSVLIIWHDTGMLSFTPLLFEMIVYIAIICAIMAPYLYFFKYVIDLGYKNMIAPLKGEFADQGLILIGANQKSELSWDTVIGVMEMSDVVYLKLQGFIPLFLNIAEIGDQEKEDLYSLFRKQDIKCYGKSFNTDSDKGAARERSKPKSKGCLIGFACFLLVIIIMMGGLGYCAYDVYRGMRDFPDYAKREVVYEKYADFLSLVDECVQKSDTVLSLAHNLEEIYVPHELLYLALEMEEDDDTIEIIKDFGKVGSSIVVVNGSGYGSLGEKDIIVIKYDVEKFDEIESCAIYFEKK